MYLSGADSPTRRGKMREAGRTDIGLMCQPRSGVLRFITFYPAWAADNGCFAQGQRFNMERWLTWVASLTPYNDACLFAVVSDVLQMSKQCWRARCPSFHAFASLASLSLSPRTMAGGLPVPWNAFDVLFIGSTRCEHAARLVAEAKAPGKGTHMGRVNGLPRRRAAQSINCDTADGTNIAFCSAQ